MLWSQQLIYQLSSCCWVCGQASEEMLASVDESSRRAPTCVSLTQRQWSEDGLAAVISEPRFIPVRWVSVKQQRQMQKHTVLCVIDRQLFIVGEVFCFTFTTSVSRAVLILTLKSDCTLLTWQNHWLRLCGPQHQSRSAEIHESHFCSGHEQQSWEERN